MQSKEFLQSAIDVQNQRAEQYDSPEGERSMGRTVQAFNAITGRDLTEAEGWLLLQTLKDVRQWQLPGRYHHDSALDGVAYSALKAEALSGGYLGPAKPLPMPPVFERPHLPSCPILGSNPEALCTCPNVPPRNP